MIRTDSRSGVCDQIPSNQTGAMPVDRHSGRDGHLHFLENLRRRREHGRYIHNLSQTKDLWIR